MNGVVDERKNSVRLRCVLEVGGDDDVGRGRDRVAGVTGLIERINAQVVANGGTGGSSADVLKCRLNELACRVLDLGVGDVVGDGVGNFEVAERPLRAFNQTGDTVVLRRLDGVDTGLAPRRLTARDAERFEIGVDLRKVVGEDARRAGVILANGEGDWQVGQGHAAIEGGDGRVVPLADFAGVNLAERVSIQFKVGHAVEVVREDDTGEGHRELNELLAVQRVQFGLRREHVRTGEVNGATKEVFATLTGANAVVVDLAVGALLVKPLIHSTITGLTRLEPLPEMLAVALV